MKKKEKKLPESTKTIDRPARLGAFLSGCIAVAGLVVGIRSCRVQETISHIHVAPQLETFVKGAGRERDLVVHNTGVVPAANVTVRTLCFLVQTDGSPFGLISNFGGAVSSDVHRTVWGFSQSLDPRQSITGRMILQGCTNVPRPYIAAHVYDISYNHPVTLTPYVKRVIYFDDGNDVMSRSRMETLPFSTNINRFIKTRLPTDLDNVWDPNIERILHGIEIENGRE